MAASSDTERTARVKFDGTAAGLARAAREAERELKRVAAAEKEQQRQAAAAEKELAGQRAAIAKEQEAIVGQVTKGVDAIGKGIVTAGSGVLKLGGLVGSAQGLAGAAGAVGTLSGALLAVPAVAVAGAIGVTTLKLAMGGVNEALSAKTPEEWTAATKDMADSAVSTAVAIRDQRDELQQLKQTVQGEFFAGLDDDVRALADTYLPLLETGLGGVAAELNGMAQASADALLDPSAVEDVNAVLGGTKDLFAELRPAVGNVLSGVLDLSAVGATRLGGLGTAVTGVTQKFKDWVAAGVESGRVNELIDDGIEAGKKLGQVVGNLAQIGGRLWDGLSEGGDDFLDQLVDTTQAVEDFLNSVEGQEAVKQLAETLGTTADVARDVLGAALREIGPLITELGPVAREVAQAFGDALVSAIETVGPLLTGLAGFLSDNKEVVGDLVPIVLGLVAAYKGMIIVTEVKGWLSGLPVLFADVGNSADSAGEKIGDVKGGKGIAGKLGGLQALSASGFTIGALLTIDAATNQGLSDALNHLAGFPDAAQRAKDGIGKDFWSQIFDAPAAKPGDENDMRNLPETLYNRWLETERLTKGIKLTPITVAANTDVARQDVEQLLTEVNQTGGEVNINGNTVGAGFALRRILEEIALGHETVTIDGEPVPAQTALATVLAQIDVGSGTVTINGNEVPAGQALAQMLGVINGSSGTVTVGADDSSARGVVNSLVQDINGRQVTIFVNAVGDRGGLASAGRLATGGPIFGPGSGTSDTAGLFALSNNEHVWTAAEVAAAGGHAAVLRLRRAVMTGSLTGLAAGGPAVAVPSYLTSGGIPLQRNASPSISVGGSDVAVSVFIDGQEFRGMVRNEIDESNRGVRRAANAGSGKGW